jgi:hypothetical protein
MCEFDKGRDSQMLTFSRGHIAYCGRRNQFVVDNLIDGFDLYQLEDGVANLLRNFPTKGVTQPLPKQVEFCEEGRAVTGGSDHGFVYVFDRRSGQILDVMPHARGRKVQTVSVCRWSLP